MKLASLLVSGLNVNELMEAIISDNANTNIATAKIRIAAAMVLTVWSDSRTISLWITGILLIDFRACPSFWFSADHMAAPSPTRFSRVSGRNLRSYVLTPHTDRRSKASRLPQPQCPLVTRGYRGWDDSKLHLSLRVG